jgi:hypothetical protein
VPLPVWFCLAFFVVVTTASLVWLFRVGLQSFRTLRSFGEVLDGITGPMTVSAERLAAASAKVDADLPRLEAARERLRVTLARTAVLRATLQEVQDSVAVALSFYPRK